MLQGSSLEEPGAVCRLGFVTPTNRPSGPGTQFDLKEENIFHRRIYSIVHYALGKTSIEKKRFLSGIARIT